MILLEGGPRVLPSYTDAMSAKALKQLGSLGVEVRLNAKVTQIDAQGVSMGSERLNSPCIVWAAGVQASPLAKHLGVTLDRAGRVPIEADLSVKGIENVYVLGDMANGTSAGKPIPGVSPAAKQMGRLAAKNILVNLQGKSLQSFVYQDYGTLATIGRRSAVVDLGFLKLSGFFAWLFWLFIHVYFLIGFRNRLLVLMEWAWSYFTFDRSARIIIGTKIPPPNMTKGPEGPLDDNF